MHPDTLSALLPDLATFARVVDAGNFSEAARQLGSTPSTISRQIKRLETALGTRLLERSTRSVRVTESGEQVYRRCRDMLEAATSAIDAASRLAAQTRGLVRFSAPISYAHYVIHPLMPAFLRAHEAVDVQLIFTDRELDPLQDDVDLVIRLTRHPPPGLAARPLGEVRWILCASPGYLQARGAPRQPADLAAHDCIYLGETPQDRHWTLHRGNTVQTVDVRGRYQANHADARLDAALRHLGIASLPEFLAAEALRSGALARVLPDWDFEPAAYTGPVWLLYPPNRFLPPKVRALIDHLAAHLPGNQA
ncbi:MAG TPA: LysR family transcriptional regulator [Bordetella sp.]